MSLTSSVERIVSIKEDIRQAIEAKGVSVSIGAGMSTYPSYIAEITGGTTPVTLISKVITSNGVYNAVDDDADGYSSVDVSVAGSGGSGDSMDKYFTRTLESIVDTNGSYTMATRGVFQSQSMLSYVSLPNCSTVYSTAFANCTELLEVYLSNKITLPVERAMPGMGYNTISNSSVYVSGIFNGCYKLQVAPPLSAFSYIPSFCFGYCSALSSMTLNMSDLSIDIFPIGAMAFGYCSNLNLYIYGDENDTLQIYERAFHFMSSVHLQIGRLNAAYTYTNYFFFSSAKVWAEISGSTFTQVSSYTFQNASIEFFSAKYANRVQYNAMAGTRMTSFYLPRLNYIVSYGLNNGFGNIELCSLPLLANVMSYGLGFGRFSKVSFPRLSTMQSYGMYQCSIMSSAYLPNLIGVASSAFYGCSVFYNVSLPKVSYISAYGLYNTAYHSRSYMLAYSGVVTLNATISNTFGALGAYTYMNFYVPSSLVDSYKVANQWSAVANRIFALETLQIRFKYNSSTYSTYWGTTWGDFINSADNTGGFYVDGDAVYSPEHTQILGATPTTRIEDDEYIWTDKYFTIDGVKYPLPYSMEWINWIGQLYNPDIPVPSTNSTVVSNSAQSPIYDGNATLVNCYDLIAESSAYTTTI